MVDFTAFYNAYWTGKDDSFDASRLALLTDRIPRGAPILEIGCGPGILGRLLREKGIAVIGVDHSEVALLRAYQKGVASLCCDPDGKGLPFRDNAFATVVSNSSVEHLFHPEEVLREIHRVLEPGGRFLWMVPNIGHWRFRLWLLLGAFPMVPNSATDLLHIRMFTARGAKGLLNSIGFRSRIVAGSAGTWVPKLYPFWLRLPLVRHLYERLAPCWPSLLCRYLVVEALKIG